MLYNVYIADHYSHDSSIKQAYSVALKQEVIQSRDLQISLVGAENTGKTSLISSFLEEEFVEGQSATKGADMEVCKVYIDNWTRITSSERTKLLHSEFTGECKGNAMKIMLSNTVCSLPSHRPSFYASFRRKGKIKHSILSSTNVTIDESEESENYPELYSQGVQKASNSSSITKQYDPDSLHVSLWDFAGQVVFHNIHSVFISDSGVSIITFNASMALEDNIAPREGFPHPPECYTIISSIHYWLQVINSVCSVKENVLLAGTHIDRLDSDLAKARMIASKELLPALEDELFEKPYAQHLTGFSGGLKNALEKSCFFISNKYRDKEIRRLQIAAVEVAASLRKNQPVFFLKIERILLQCNKQIVSKSTLLDLITNDTHSIDINHLELEGILRYFHNKRTILHFSQIESLKDLIILSPHWLAKLFGYVITADTYIKGGEFDWAWKRLYKYGILHECLLKHMLDKFHSDYPTAVHITIEQVVDILLCFRLLARITTEVWFIEEKPHCTKLPESGETFIVPSLARNDNRNIPKDDNQRIIYFKFYSGFVPINLLNQLIADCICYNVRKNYRLLW